MRGLRLFIRPVEASDRESIAAFAASNDGTSRPGDVPVRGLLGKLLGEIVAVLALAETEGELRIEELVVKRTLRKKRIGRAMIRDAVALAAQQGRRRLVVDAGCAGIEFFGRVGFREEGERWVLDISGK